MGRALFLRVTPYDCSGVGHSSSVAFPPLNIAVFSGGNFPLNFNLTQKLSYFILKIDPAIHTANLILHIIVMGSLYRSSPWTRVAATHLFYRDNDFAVLAGSKRSPDTSGIFCLYLADL